MKHAQAAVLIDGENISYKRAGSIEQYVLTNLPRQRAQIKRAFVYGNAAVLQYWQSMVVVRPLECYVHQGGKEAADQLMKQGALTLRDQGIRVFYLASNDGGFATTVSRLTCSGCLVYGLGYAHASRKLRAACNDFFVLEMETSIVAETRLVMEVVNEVVSEEGDFMRDSYMPLANQHLTGTIEDAIQILYHASSLPVYLPRLLSLFLEQTFRTFCLTEQESEIAGELQNPADYADVLEAIEQDPLLGRLLIPGGPQEQWKAVLNFARGCEYAYLRGQEEAKSAFHKYPQAVPTDLVDEYIKQKVMHWHRLSTFDIPEKYRTAYSSISSEAQQVVMRRWYRRGYMHGIAQGTVAQRQTWVPTPLEPSESLF